MATTVNPADIALAATSPRLVTVSLANNLLFGGNVTGTINGVSAADISNSINNFNSSNDQNGTTVVAPTVTTTAITHTNNDDGAVNVKFTWAWSGTDSTIDGFIVYALSTTSSAAYTITGTAENETVYVVPAGKKSITIYGAPAPNYYTFGVRAYRRVDTNVSANGILASNVIQPTASGQNPYRPSAAVAINVTTVNNTAVGNYLNSNVSLSGSNGTISLTGGSGSATGIIMTGNPITSTNATTYIGTNSISTGLIAAGAINADKIAANAVIAGKIAADAVTAGTIAANAVTAGKIAANAVTAGTVAANAITAGTIAANAVTAGTVAANAIVAGSIATNAITADKINAGAITADKILAGAITADKISVTNLSAITANLGTINSGIINAGTINAGNYTGYAWPTTGAQNGAHLGPAGILAGNANITGRGYLQFEASTGNFLVGRAGGKYIHFVANDNAFYINGDIIATGNIQLRAVTEPNVAVGTVSSYWGPGIALYLVAGQPVIVWASYPPIPDGQAGLTSGGAVEIRYGTGDYSPNIIPNGGSFTPTKSVESTAFVDGGETGTSYTITNYQWSPTFLMVSFTPGSTGTWYLRLVNYQSLNYSFRNHVIAAVQARR
jgi:hypothetical protein